MEENEGKIDGELKLEERKKGRKEGGREGGGGSDLVFGIWIFVWRGIGKAGK